MTSTPSGITLGVDVGGTKVLGLVVDGTGSVLARTERPTPRLTSNDLGSRVADEVAAVVECLLKAAELETNGARVGVGLPGMVGLDGVLLVAPNLRSAAGADMRALVSERLDDAQVAVANDADCAALAEQRLGAARGHDDVIVVTLGTGIGGGMIVGGTLMQGARGFAGEIGHMVVDPAGPTCPCGSKGCWERFASGSAVGRLARDVAHAGGLESVVARAGGDAEAVRGVDVTRAALEGDEAALAIINEVGWWLARGLANLIAVLDPSCIVIGGGLSAAASLLVPAAQRHLPSLVEGGDRRPPIGLFAAHFGPDAGALGASLLVREAS